jgi:hypothetical protein
VPAAKTTGLAIPWETDPIGSAVTLPAVSRNK